MRSKFAALIAGGLAGVAICGASNAAVVELSFSQVIAPPSVAMAGTAPWLNVKIEDTATPGTVALTVAASLIGAQTLTGIWLNVPKVAAAVTSFTSTDTDGNGTGEDPMAFAAIDASPTNSQSAFHTTQNLHPGGTTKAQAGDSQFQFRYESEQGQLRGDQAACLDRRWMD
jgi:hypothetical protein